MATSYFRDPNVSYRQAQYERKLAERKRQQRQQQPQEPTQAEPAPQQITTPAPAPTRAQIAPPAPRGMQVVPGGQPLARPAQRAQASGGDLAGDIKRALSGAQKVAKPAGELADYFTQSPSLTFDRGAAEPAFQQQRAGERQERARGSD